jgi:hypothetical protein
MTASSSTESARAASQWMVLMSSPLAQTPRAATLAILVLAAALVTRPNLAQAQGTWKRIGDPSNPPPFNGQVAAYDSTLDRVLVYQPYSQWAGAPYAAADVWEFRLGSPELGWRKLTTSGAAPLGHVQASVAVDEAHRRLLIYGGWMPYGGSMTNDLYALSLDGPPVWSVIPTTSDSLRVRLDAFLAVDPAGDRLVLHGGSANFGDHYGAVDDVWTLPLDGPAVWTLVPVTGPLPPVRSYSQRAWDPLGGRVLVHGGSPVAGFPLLTDTWALTVGPPAQWEQIATTGPQIMRTNGGALVDAAHNRLLLAPGNSGLYPPPASDQWVYELPLAPGGEWAVTPAADSFDVSGYQFSVLHDTRRERLLTAGTTFTQAFSLGDGSGWARLWPPDPVVAPEQATGEVLVADPQHEVVWWVGGSELCGFDGVWKLDATDAALWTWYPQPIGLAGGGHAVALDAAGHQLLMSNNGSPDLQISSFGTDGAPSAVVWPPQGNSAPQRVEHSMVVDPVRRQLVVFGGQIYLAHFSGYSYADVWTVPLDDLSAWTPLTPAGPGPGARGDHFAFWDDAHDRMVVLGGWRQQGGPIRHYFHDAWALTLAGSPAWSKLDSTVWDPPVTGSLTYDPVNRRLFLFHADDWSVPPSSTVYTRGVNDEDAWELLATAGDEPGFSAPIAFAPWCLRLVVASTNGSGPQSDEVWALDVDRSVPALASLESVEASPDRVAIVWRVSGAGPFTLSRLVDDGGWTTLGPLMPDGQGRVAYEDRDLSPGQRLVYRLADGARTLAEQDVLVPGRTALAFAGARPSPVRGAARLAFSLGADSPVTLELFDVRGARVLSRRLGVQAAGDHEWTWPETARLRPGLYLARLTTNAGRRDARMVLLP